MKKQSITPEKGRRKTCGNRWRDLRKRLLVMGLTVSMVANTVDLTSLAVSAKTEESRLTIVSFETLSKDVTEQTLPVGALESDIILPASLTVTVEKTMQTETDDTKKENQDQENQDQKDQDEKDQDQKDTDKEDQDQKDPASETDPENPSAGKDGDEGEEPNGENGDGENGSDGQDEEEPQKPEDQEDAQGSQKPEGQENAQDAQEPGDLEDAEKAGNPAEEGAASGNENGSDSTDTEDTQAHAGLPSAFGALLTQLADTFLPSPL